MAPRAGSTRDSGSTTLPPPCSVSGSTTRARRGSAARTSQEGTMARTNTYIDEWLTYWNRVGQQFNSRIANASADAREGKYGWERLFSDGVSMWCEGVDNWWSAVSRRPLGDPPVLFFRILPKTEAKGPGEPIPLRGATAPTATDLVNLAQGDKNIPRGCIRIDKTDGDEAVIKLVNLPSDLQAGHYLGMVYAD